jgi:hypothetical protein
MTILAPMSRGTSRMKANECLGCKDWCECITNSGRVHPLLLHPGLLREGRGSGISFAGAVRKLIGIFRTFSFYLVLFNKIKVK